MKKKSEGGESFMRGTADLIQVEAKLFTLAKLISS